MKTRAKKGVSPHMKDEEKAVPAKTAKSLFESVTEPPHVFVLPDIVSPAARVASLQHPATGKPARFLIDPAHGFYEFTRIAGPKEQCRSWLFAPDMSSPAEKDVQHEAAVAEAEDAPEKDDGADVGYVLQTPDLFVATPFDPLFIILPALAGTSNTAGQEYLAPSDYIAILAESSPHLRQIMRNDSALDLEKLFNARIEAVCDIMDLGDEVLYALSLSKLANAFISKAKAMVAAGLPASMEERFVRQALEVPVASIRREESDVSVATEASDAGDLSSEHISQDSNISTSTKHSITTAATSSSLHSMTAVASCSDLLRVRVALQFIGKSYLSTRLHALLDPLLLDSKVTGIDFGPLDTHLAHIEGLKKQAQALRSLSDNISRKRSTIEEDDELATKRQKREEAEEKKKSVSVGIKKLMKADTSGMKKLSSFFAKKG